MKLIGVFSHSYIESMPQSFVIHLYSGTTYKNTPPKQEETLESAKFRGFFLLSVGKSRSSQTFRHIYLPTGRSSKPYGEINTLAILSIYQEKLYHHY